MNHGSRRDTVGPCPPYVKWFLSHFHTPMRICRVFTLLACFAVLLGSGRTVLAQAQEPSRQGSIEQAQAEKVKTLHPYPVSTGERLMNKVEDITVNGGRTGIRSSTAPTRAAASRWAPATCITSARTTSSTCAAATRSSGYKRVEAEFIAPRLFHRRGDAVAARRLARSHPGRLLRHRHRHRRRTTGRTTRSRSRTHRRLLTRPADAAVPDAARRPRVDTVEAAAGRGTGSIGRNACTRRRRCPAWRRIDVPAHAGHGWLRLAHLARLFAARRLLRRHAFTTTTTATRRSASSRWTTKSSSTSRSCARPGSSRCAASPRPRRQKERSGDPVLHAALARRRHQPARLQQLALPRSEQPAAAGRVAHHGQPLPGFGGVLRRRQGRRPHRRISTSTG